MLGKKLAVQRENLRDVHHRIAPQPGGPRWKQDIARRIRKIQVRGNHRNQCGLDAAAIERVGLNDENGAAVAGLRPSWSRKMRPPEFAAPDVGPVTYPPFFLRDFTWAR